ncbi:MAG: cytochrome b/b6 domain-containing protein [Magnetococcales bacterium]|nr:cytochrome b/b6 domain-containing protein [Magnetococcales bacterium]
MIKSVLISTSWIFCILLLITMFPVIAESASVSLTEESFDNRTCFECHDGREVIKVLDTSPYAENGEKRDLVAIPPNLYATGVHARMLCTDCHHHIVHLQPPHQAEGLKKVDCASCHEALAQSGEQKAHAPPSPGNEKVRSNIKKYRSSFHARPNRDNPDFPNATCHECHDSHFFSIPMDQGSPAYGRWRLTINKLCGKCHEDQIEEYDVSVHGIALKDKGNLKSATCIDCHTAHEVTGAHLEVFKLQSPDTCGHCHQARKKTYRSFYHGQMTKIGFSETAKCYDCHGSHKIFSAKDPRSLVHPKNRLKTCQKCHDGQRRPLATEGFASFSPHDDAMDYDQAPQLWIAARFMNVLEWVVFVFFSLHTVLWWYREWRERRNETGSSGLAMSGLKMEEGSRHFQRFPLVWRVAHLLFALVVMILLLTGMILFNTERSWAPALVRLLGGAAKLGFVHHVMAVLLVSIFLLHIVHVLQHLFRKKGFDWFGPDSLLPNRKDFTDCIDMFRWFVGRGEKPRFDRWTYYEKFDYWAVFWGVAVIGSSGAILAFPHIAGEYMGGWVFNVSIKLHGEEAFLAAVFLFTVHFSNNHFRPSKLPPPDVVMFTGSLSLEELQRDHPAQLERIRAKGELDSYLVEKPSVAMVLGSKLLGLLLLATGLVLLFMAVSGYTW